MGKWLDENLKPAGWMLANTYERFFGTGVKESLRLENIKIKLTNMASKIIGMLHNSLNKETQTIGKQAAKDAKKMSRMTEKGKASKDMAKAPSRQASMRAKAPAMAAGKTAVTKAAKPILSTDINATIAKATLAAGKGSQALISGKGLDTKALDLGR